VLFFLDPFAVEIVEWHLDLGIIHDLKVCTCSASVASVRCSSDTFFAASTDRERNNAGSFTRRGAEGVHSSVLLS
jgi:hypothetical protein